MRSNGKIWYAKISGGGLDANGEPIPSKEEWSEAVECAITTNNDTRKGKYEDGEFRQASFTVLIEGYPEESPKRVKLERYGEPLGEYRVLTVTPLPMVGRTQFMV